MHVRVRVYVLRTYECSYLFRCVAMLLGVSFRCVAMFLCISFHVPTLGS